MIQASHPLRAPMAWSTRGSPLCTGHRPDRRRPGCCGPGPGPHLLLPGRFRAQGGAWAALHGAAEACAACPGHRGHHLEAQTEQPDLQGLQQRLQPGRGPPPDSRAPCECRSRAVWEGPGWARGCWMLGLAAARDPDTGWHSFLRPNFACRPPGCLPTICADLPLSALGLPGEKGAGAEFSAGPLWEEGAGGSSLWLRWSGARLG